MASKKITLGIQEVETSPVSDSTKLITSGAVADGLNGKVDKSITVTINGVSQDLSANRSWTVSGGGGSGSGIEFAMQSTAPSTDVVWIDTSVDHDKAHPIRYYINGAWTPVTDICDHYDTLTNVISRGRPICILWSGQSNIGAAGSTSIEDPTDLGDRTPTPFITIWSNKKKDTNVAPKGEFVIFDLGFSEDPTNFTLVRPAPYYPIAGSGASNIFVMAKHIYKETGRSVRLVGTRFSGTSLHAWEEDGEAWIQTVEYATDSEVQAFDSFVWMHGEAEYTGSTFPNYREAFKDFITRLKAQPFFKRTTKIIAGSHGLSHNSPTVPPNSSEDTIRSLALDEDQYTGWAEYSFKRDDPKYEPSSGASTSLAADPYHFTTREHRIMGEAWFQTWKSLPKIKRPESTLSVVSTRATDGFPTKLTTVYPRVDTIQTEYHSRTGVGEFINYWNFNPGSNSSGTSWMKVYPTGAFGKSNIEFGAWTNKNLTISELGSIIHKKTMHFDKMPLMPNGSNFDLEAHGNVPSDFPGYSSGVKLRFAGNVNNQNIHIQLVMGTPKIHIEGNTTGAIGFVGINTETPTSQHHVNGSEAASVSNITSSTTLDATHNVVVASSASGAVIITLPNPNTCIGRLYEIIASNITNALTISGTIVTTGATYSSGSPFSFTTQWQTKRLRSIGTSWVMD